MYLLCCQAKQGRKYSRQKEGHRRTGRARKTQTYEREGDGEREGGGYCILEGKLQFTLKTRHPANTEPCKQFTSLIGWDKAWQDGAGDGVPLAVYPGSGWQEQRETWTMRSDIHRLFLFCQIIHCRNFAFFFFALFSTYSPFYTEFVLYVLAAASLFAISFRGIKVTAFYYSLQLLYTIMWTPTGKYLMLMFSLISQFSTLCMCV